MFLILRLRVDVLGQFWMVDVVMGIFVFVVFLLLIIIITIITYGCSTVTTVVHMGVPLPQIAYVDFVLSFSKTLSLKHKFSDLDCV
jgi:hypothetical protein